jgi:excinuclease ABC subunit B
VREGLDLPEVSLVTILDADKEGFLRSETSLIQTFGRAARNIAGRVVLYADCVTGSMKKALEETNRRRKIQEAYNRKNGITPETVKKAIPDILTSIYEADYVTVPAVAEKAEEYVSIFDLPKKVSRLKKEMREAAARLDFEKAAEIRDRIKSLEKVELEYR